VVREIQDQLYTDTPGGLAGNDDLGAMSSWYVWSALGAYPETPGSAQPVLGSPLFNAIAIHLADGHTITETAPAAADDAPYVESLTVNGSPWSQTSLPAGVFSTGATLAWTLGTAPDTAWGQAAADAPPSSTTGLLPALGFASVAGNGDVMVAPGAEAPVTLGVQGMTATADQVTWAASTPAGSGVTVAPGGATLAVTGEAKVTQPLEIQVAPDTAAGQYLVTVSLVTASHQSLPDVVVEVDVT